VTTKCSVPVPAIRRAAVMESINALNGALRFGCFYIDRDENVIVCQHAAMVSDEECAEQVGRIILTNLQTAHRCFEPLLRQALGSTSLDDTLFRIFAGDKLADLERRLPTHPEWN
jgi:hypothetical protein